MGRAFVGGFSLFACVFGTAAEETEAIFRLRSETLTVELLNPHHPTNASRLGARFCHAGYIWQVRDEQGEPLLTGPEWPEAEPSPYNGQGMPEAFRHEPVLPPATPIDEPFALGAGTIVGDDDRPVLRGPCQWTVKRGDNFIEFATCQGDGYVELALTRQVQLTGATLVSASRITNLGQQNVRIVWFSHPFFPLPPDRMIAQFPQGWTLPPNPVYAFDQHAALCFIDTIGTEDKKAYQILQGPDDAPFNVVVAHSRLGGVKYWTDFSPQRCPVWCNLSTVSIEPHLIAEVEPGASQEWSVSYTFGVPTSFEPGMDHSGRP